jgi:hypothetical protein
MPTNEYYDSTGSPITNSPGSAVVIQGEFIAVEAGFLKLPTLAGNANKPIFVNSTGTKLEAKEISDAITLLQAEETAHKDISGGYVGLTLFKINFKNAADTFTSFLTNTNTASRTYTFPDISGTVATLDDISNNGSRNFIINGGFQIWQRGTSHTTAGFGSDDRWYIGALGSTFVNSRQTHTPGQTDVPNNPTYYCRDVITTSAGNGNYCSKSQRIEGVNTLSGTNATISFYAKADASKNIAIELVQHFGTGGTPSADVTEIGSQKIALTTSWVFKEVTISIPSISGKTLGSNGDDYLEVIFWMDAGSDFNARTATLGQQSGTFEFSDIQLELGSVSSAFERKTISDELESCLRYCHVSGGQIMFSGNTTDTIDYVGKADLAVTMRAIPSVTLTNVANTNFTSSVGSVLATTGTILETRTANATAASGYFRSTFVAEAEL